MRVLVCIKQITYFYHPFALDASESSLDLEKMALMLNPYDEVAVEAAVRIKERYGDCEIVAITAGLPNSEKALRYAFAMGADKMVRIDFEGFDPWLTALALANTVQGMQFDIVLCGEKAIDNNAGQVGSFLGELLEVPQVSGIVGLELFPERKMALADRYLGRGGDRQIVGCPLPALFTVEDGLNYPRYPTLGRRLLAEKEKVEVIKIDIHKLRTDKNMDLTASMRLSPPRPKPKKTFTPDSSLSASERMRLIMSGGVTEKTGKLLQGKADEVAEKILDVLVQEGIV